MTTSGHVAYFTSHHTLSPYSMKLLLVDDHVLFREALALVLAGRLPGVQVIGAGTLDEAERQLQRHLDLRLVLLAHGRRDSNVQAAPQRWRDLGLILPLLVVVAPDDGLETVLAAIEQGLRDGPESGPAPALTPRQRDVLGLLVAGRTNRQIGQELSLSESTVKTHLTAIFGRLGVGSRTQAVVRAAQLGLHAPPPARARSVASP